MKVLQVVSDMNIGGAGKVVINLIKTVPPDKIHFKVVIPRGSRLKSEISSCGVEVIEASGIADKSFSLRGILSLFIIILKEQPDIVHAHAGLSARVAAKTLGKKIAFTRHWRGQTDTSKISRFLNNMLCDTAFAVSKTAYDSLRETGIDERKIALLYNGIEPLVRDESKKLLNDLNITDKIIVGIAARLEEVKNHKCLLDAASIILRERKDIMFLLAGEGSLESSLSAYANKLAIRDNVKFLGFVSDMSAFMSALDINVICSFEEAFPLSVLEAMSIGVPTIATACGGTEEQIESGKNGFLTENSPEMLASDILLLASDPILRTKLGQAAFETYKSKFGAEKFAAETLNIYTKMRMEDRK